MNYSTIYKRGNLNGYKFRKFSDYVVANYVSAKPGQSPLTLGELEGISETLAMDMATGAELVKNRYLVRGILIGSVVVTGLVFIHHKRKQKKA